MFIIFLFIIFLVVVIALLCVEYWFLKGEKSKKISFKTAMELAELPVVTFCHGNKKLHFLLDTGSNNSIISSNCIKGIQYTKTNVNMQLCGNEGHNQTITEVIHFNIKHNNYIYDDDFQVVDMSAPFKAIKKETGVTVHGILGNAFFSKYKYILDFKDMVAYSKKK